MNKLFVICGKSASGKDTIIEQLVENYNYKRVISYTTRPMRLGEVNGREYNFVTNEEFLEMIRRGDIIEYNMFHTDMGDWYYGTGSDIVDKLKESNLICIKEPSGIKQLINSIGYENIVPILIQRSAYERLISSLNRMPYASDKESLEVCRRLIEDEKDFIEIESENIKVIHNKFINSTVYQVSEYINGNKFLYWNCENNILIGDKVRIDNIKTEDGKHLIRRIGQEGVIVSYIIKYGQKRYKVKFNDDDTAYFFRSELEKIEEEGR